ncbi:glycoside hydrolase family 16 protein [Conidiobolus coronatus NRRL 28638]|uniref:Glycoside hydrolase family 16 protein n=1 Tax=Conidiobolus coronatus (strain ATCC 28846 / CBS 209.66 / NRRL 28638) TaxID=796925 RepID=A0A137P4C4_CONC2|nr:glycoside hydrolase family 16 protein [Conidiobolus coronatus NRRL 28638]|eukprot:KXN69865.1 glycoside hydrolase family 16 protein [Conidiobolus coronatus NRRL 28638]
MIDYRKATNDPINYNGKAAKNNYFFGNSSSQTQEAPSDNFGNLIFEDNFDDFNMKTWKHDITLGGGGNWEFEYYTNNRSSSFVKNGQLHIRPVLTSEMLGEAAVVNGGTIDLWGNQPNMKCTANAFYGCMRSSNGNNYLNPIQSALIRSHEKFSFTYGKVEIRARLPKGDWIWPAIWMLPADHNYGSWPSSGEIDIVESRGNDPGYPGQGRNMFASTLHWGPSWDYNRYQMTTASYALPGGQSFSDDFHTFTLEWTGDYLRTYVDNQPVLTVNYDKSYWDRGQFPSYLNNPWQGRSKSAPFDRDFYLIFNVAVGGTNGYFPEGAGNKPWSNQSPVAMKEFWDNRNQWLPTWPKDDRRDLIIDYVRVYSL